VSALRPSRTEGPRPRAQKKGAAFDDPASPRNAGLGRGAAASVAELCARRSECALAERSIECETATAVAELVRGAGAPLAEWR
jgi:hypothetical protein